MKISQTLSFVLLSLTLLRAAFGESLTAISLTPEEVQRLGISASPLQEKAVGDPVVVTGELAIDPTRRRAVSSFFAGQVVRDHKQLGEGIVAGEELCKLRSREVGEVMVAYLEAVEKLETARVLYEREKGLKAKKMTTEDAYLNAFATYREARAAQAAAMQMALLVRTPVELTALREGGLTPEFTDMAIKAPLTGLVIGKMKSAGDAVEGNEVFCELADLSQLLVELRVPLQAMGWVRVGGKIDFETVVGETRRGSATIVRVNPIASGQSLTATVYATLSNEEGQWLVGTPVNASLVSPDTQKVLAAPAGALVSIEGESYLFVELEGDYRPVAVTLGVRSQQWVEIVDGLDEGARVVGQRASLLLAAYEERAGEE
ncbi:MAG: efflux RND transporter periplasmic adaptor subunit [Roseibacillus sp.]